MSSKLWRQHKQTKAKYVREWKKLCKGLLGRHDRWHPDNQGLVAWARSFLDSWRMGNVIYLGDLKSVKHSFRVDFSKAMQGVLNGNRNTKNDFVFFTVMPGAVTATAPGTEEHSEEEP